MEKYKAEFAKVVAFSKQWKQTQMMAEKRCGEHKKAQADTGEKVKSKAKKSSKSKQNKKSKRTDDDDDDDEDEEIDGEPLADDE